MEFVENIAMAIDKKQYAVSVFVDLHKAFDTINHYSLLQKLEHYGIRGVTLKWIRSYSNITGLSQGSVLGPKLFILYLNDICAVFNRLKFVTFADDTTLFCSGPDIKELLSTVERELIMLKEWFDINKLSLNENKTKCMVFSGVRANCEIKSFLNGVKIVHETKFLGVILDHKFSWKSHIAYIKKKVSKSRAGRYG